MYGLFTYSGVKDIDHLYENRNIYTEHFAKMLRTDEINVDMNLSII